MEAGSSPRSISSTPPRFVIHKEMPAIALRASLIIPFMSKLISIVGASGVGKTTLVRALARRFPPVLSKEHQDDGSSVEGFQTAYEGHAERPFQTLFKEDPRYALANQIDYLLECAEQEKQLRTFPQVGLMDGGLDLDFHGFTRLFHQRALLTDSEFELCRRVYNLLRETLPRPELFVRLCTDASTITSRLSTRDRINIARAEDTALFNSFLDEWLASIPSDQVLELDVSHETLDYEQSVNIVLNRVQKLS